MRAAWPCRKCSNTWSARKSRYMRQQTFWRDKVIAVCWSSQFTMRTIWSKMWSCHMRLGARTPPCFEHSRTMSLSSSEAGSTIACSLITKTPSLGFLEAWSLEMTGTSSITISWSPRPLYWSSTTASTLKFMLSCLPRQILCASWLPTDWLHQGRAGPTGWGSSALAHTTVHGWSSICIRPRSPLAKKSWFRAHCIKWNKVMFAYNFYHWWC